MDVVDCINKYLKEQPQDELIFQEVSQRAELSRKEERILWEAIERYCAAILDFHIKEFCDKLKGNTNANSH